MTIIIVMSYSSTSFASNKNAEIESELKVLENEKNNILKDIKEQLIAQGKLSHYKYYVVKINNEYQVIKNTVLKKNNIFLDDKLETLSSDYYNSYFFPNGASVSYKVPVGYDISYKEDFFTKTQSNRFYKKYLQDRGKIKIKDLLTFVLSGLSLTNVIASTALFSLGGLDLIGNYVTEKN